jgi:hypothetical protein
MSYATDAAPAPPPPRHALGLPAGSVRAILGLGVLGALWAMAFEPKHDQAFPLAFIYLQSLMMLILAHYFAAHGNKIGPKTGSGRALGLPSGTVRFVLLVGYLGLTWYLFKERSQLNFETEAQGNIILYLATILTGFFVGHLLTGLVQWLSGGTLPFWFQDLQAWVAIVSMLGLAGLIIIHVFINPNVSPDLKIHGLDVVLATLVAFYFGART